MDFHIPKQSWFREKPRAVLWAFYQYLSVPHLPHLTLLKDKNTSKLSLTPLLKISASYMRHSTKYLCSLRQMTANYSKALSSTKAGYWKSTIKSTKNLALTRLQKVWYPDPKP